MEYEAKYKVSISYGLKIMAKVKDKQTDRQEKQKQYAPDHSIRGHKNNMPRSIDI